MSKQAFVVMPVGSAVDGLTNRQDPAKIASAVQQSLDEQRRPKLPALPEPEQKGPLKEILAHQESLYKYLSWEDPFRTLGSYIALVSLLVGAHYMPLTRWALKAGAYTLGAVSVAETVSRSFGRDTFLSRLRPKPYKKIPEPVLNATLKDIHDFAQYGAVQCQRILFGEDLEKTFAGFLGFLVMYWLIGVASPFALSLLGLTALYIAPLVISPKSRKIARGAAQASASIAEDLASTAVDSGKSAIDSGKATVNSGINMASNNINQAAEQSAKIRDAAVDMSTRAGNTAVESGKTAIDSTKNLAHDTATRASEQSAKIRDTAVDMSTRAGKTAVESGKTAIDSTKNLAHSTATRASEVPAKARDTGANISNQAGATFSNVVGTQNQRSGHASNQAEAETGEGPNYVVDRKAAPTSSSSSIPRVAVRTSNDPALHREGPIPTEKLYTDPVSQRI